MCTTEDHERTKLASGIFRLLVFVGYWPVNGFVLELRNCPDCGSTLARKRISIDGA